MPDGSMAEMVRYLGTEEAPHAYSTGYFMRDGILYEATALGNLSTKEEVVGGVLGVLHRFPSPHGVKRGPVGPPGPLFCIAS